jgi:hypothetical protein
VDVVLKRVFVKRFGDAGAHVYTVAVEDLEPIAVKEVLLGHVLGLLLGVEASDALKTVIYGPTGEFDTRVWINSAQAAALEVLMIEYRIATE